MKYQIILDFIKNKTHRIIDVCIKKNAILAPFYISLKNFLRHRLFTIASSLTYFSLMATVPFFALIIFIAQKLGYQEHMEHEILAKFEKQKEIIDKLIEFAKNLINQTSSGIIALIGIIFIFWSIINVLSNLETSVNTVWKIQTPRKFNKRLSNYFIFLILISLFLVTIVAIKIYMYKLFATNELNHFFLKLGFKTLPFIMILALFFYVNIKLPLKKVKAKYAFYSALFSASLYQLVQMSYFIFQSNLTKLNAIYGSFAALPLFLIWIQISWIIFLYGVELCYTLQNLKSVQ